MSKIPLTDVEKYWIILQLLFSMSILHSVDLPHGNLDIENLLLTHTNQLFISDFGILNPHYY